MKKIVFSLLILAIFCEYASASAIYESRILNTSGKSAQIYSNNGYGNQNYSTAINEIKNKISKNPNDYILNTYLIDLYLKSGNFLEAYNELIYLTNLSRQGKLNKLTIENISKIKKSFPIYTRNSRDKSIAYLNLTLINLILNENEQAEKAIIAAAKNITNEKAFTQTLNLVFQNSEDTEKSLISFDKMLINNPNNVSIKKQKALYLKQLNRTEEATKEYLSAFKLSPTDEEIIYNLYNIYGEKNLSPNDIMKKLFGKNNTETDWALLSKILLERNEIENAENLTKDFIKKYPENVDALINLSEIYRRGGKLKESYDILQQIRDKADTTERISKYNVLLAKLSNEPVQEANSLMNNGLFEQALSVLHEADADNLYVILSKARAYYFTGDKQNSLELLNRAMSFYPNNADVFYYFAFYFYQEKNLESARKYIDKTLSLEAEHQYGLQLLDLINKADANKLTKDILSAIEMENYAEAMRLTNEALAINQKDDNLYFYKGIIYTSMNDYNLATAPLYKTLELNPNNILAYYYLAVCFDNLSEKENALSYYKQFLDNIPIDNYGESEKIKYAQVRIQKLSE